MSSAIKKKLSRFAFIIALILLAFIAFVELSNRHSENMTYRQKVLKAFYPAWMWWSRLVGSKTDNLNQMEKQPVLSFYDLKANLNSGDTLNFSSLKGKKVLLVNTASNCGYTGQYAELQKLYEKHKDKLEIIAFPANDFREQEKGTDEEIASFCKVNFGISFPLMKKTSVVAGAGQHPVYQWLTDPAKNGWNSREPEWNFSKYLVNEEGMLTNYFGTSISPLDAEVEEALKK